MKHFDNADIYLREASVLIPLKVRASNAGQHASEAVASRETAHAKAIETASLHASDYRLSSTASSLQDVARQLQSAASQQNFSLGKLKQCLNCRPLEAFFSRCHGISG